MWVRFNVDATPILFGWKRGPTQRDGPPFFATRNFPQLICLKLFARRGIGEFRWLLAGPFDAMLISLTLVICISRRLCEGESNSGETGLLSCEGGYMDEAGRSWNPGSVVCSVLACSAKSSLTAVSRFEAWFFKCVAWLLSATSWFSCSEKLPRSSFCVSHFNSKSMSVNN